MSPFIDNQINDILEKDDGFQLTHLADINNDTSTHSSPKKHIYLLFQVLPPSFSPCILKSTAGGLETGRFFERFMKMEAKQKVAVVR